MSEFVSVDRINTLKSGIESKTGETYADLTEGVQALMDGYGQGGASTGLPGFKMDSGQFTLATDVDTYDIMHGLGAIPMYAAVILDDDKVMGNQLVYSAAARTVYSALTPSETELITCNVTTTGAGERYGANTYDRTSINGMDATKISIGYTTTTKWLYAGTTYRWIAISFDA